MGISSFDELADLVFSKLSALMAEHEGLEIFAVERAKFEGWVKVELVGILKRHFETVVPEAGGIDVVADDWAIELKTVNTNYRHPLAKSKTRPVTYNVKLVLRDIEKLRRTNYPKKAVLFIVFPLPDKSLEKWEKTHLSKIRSKLRKLRHHGFEFRNGVPAIIYLGYV